MFENRRSRCPAAIMPYASNVATARRAKLETVYSVFDSEVCRVGI